MKKSSFLVLCMILLNGLGCSLVPNNGIGSGSARLAGRSRGPDFVTLVKQLQPAVVNVSVTMLPVPPSTRGVQPQGNFGDGTFGEFFGALGRCRLSRCDSKDPVSSLALRVQFSPMLV